MSCWRQGDKTEQIYWPLKKTFINEAVLYITNEYIWTAIKPVEDYTRAYGSRGLVIKQNDVKGMQ